MMNVRDYALWTAIVTPLKSNGELDLKGFENLLRKQEAAGNGVVILGSTGEALNLSKEEQQALLDCALSLNLKVPLMCGVGGVNLDYTQKFVEDYLEKLPLDAYLMVTPLYAKPGDEGQIRWFETLLNSASKPCMLYNVPSRTGTSLSKKAVRQLRNHENFWAIKEASGSVEEFNLYREAAPEVDLYSGDDVMLPAFSEHGARGVVSVAGNVWPKATALYTRQCLEESFSHHDLWKKSCQALFGASNPIPAKRLLFEKGWISS